MLTLHIQVKSVLVSEYKGRKEWGKGDREGVTYRKAIKGETGCVRVYLGFFPAGYVFHSFTYTAPSVPPPM